MNEITNSVEVATNALAAASVAGGMNGTVFNGLDLAVIICLCRRHDRDRLVFHAEEERVRQGLLPVRPRRQLAADRLLDLLLQHRFRTPRRSGRRRLCHRHGDGPLGNACLLDPRAGLGLCAALRPHEGVHHAGVSRTPLQPRFAQRPEPAHHGQSGADENRRHDLRRRRRHPHAC